LMSITEPPKNAPITAPSIKPTIKEQKEVNSTFGGLGVIWRAKHNAIRIVRRASFRVFNWLSADGKIIHPTYIRIPVKIL